MNYADALDEGIIVCGYKLRDMMYTELREYLPDSFEMLLVASRVKWEHGLMEGVAGIPMPLKAYELMDALQGMLERMEKINTEGQRAFLYGITMENHQPFDAKKFGYECQIGVECGKLNRDNMFILKVMLEGITRADQALGWLTDTLRESDEPTVVVFFGDHRPNLFMIDGETVYTKLGLCPENDTLHWTAEQINDLYSTDYLIWANDAALLQGQAGTKKESSITAIGPQLLKLTGQPVSRYWGLLEKVSEVCLTNTELYFVNGEGVASRSAPEQEELLQLLDAVIYDALYGRQYITAAMNEPAEKAA